MVSIKDADWEALKDTERYLDELGNHRERTAAEGNNLITIRTILKHIDQLMRPAKIGY